MIAELLRTVALLSAVGLAAYLGARPSPPDFDPIAVHDYPPVVGRTGPFAPGVAREVPAPQRLFQGQTHGPETVWFGADGTLFTVATHHGRVLAATGPGGALRDWAFTGGMPLAGEAVPGGSGDLYLTDGLLGLVVVDAKTRSTRIVCNQAGGRRVAFADDLTVAADGRVFFTDASKIPPTYRGGGYYDGLLASRWDFADGHKSGRVLVYDPAAATCTVVADGFWFPNGIALTKAQDALIVAETMMRRVLRIPLAGPNKHKTEVFTPPLPFMVDSMSEASDGGFWVAGVSPEIGGPAALMQPYPWVKQLVVRLPEETVPVHIEGAVIKLGADGKVQFVIHLPTTQVTAICEREGKLYLGNLVHDFVPVVPISV